MSTTHDELAGVVDLFGALTHAELTTALGELAFKKGQDVDETALEAAIESAVRAYALVEYEPADRPEASASETLVTVGPLRFPRCRRTPRTCRISWISTADQSTVSDSPPKLASD